ncbi:glycosyltransferase family 2 protein [Algoriphagus aquimarinus]|uniref:glycosyltransferase family 2 protein n=1 Tax=Algoriphagus aquimarinus TaxID=237018 RepID=UPI00174E899D|nr:glycosyltransferase family A protein [Algoriphagus aquimarinus]
MTPKFSIIIPSFNRAASVGRTIESLLDQTDSNWEIILVDDGSTDHTKILIEKYLSDPRIHYYFKKNEGVSLARNYGSNYSTGDFLIFLDSDDQLEREALENFSKLIFANPNSKIIQAGFTLLDDDLIIKSVVIPKSNTYTPFLSGNFVIRRDFFQSIGGYDSQLNFAENTELFHRIKLANSDVVLGDFISLRYLDQPLGGSKNLRNSSRSIAYILDKHDLSLPLATKNLYWQIIGVNHLRFREFGSARTMFRKALKYKLFQPKALIRLSLACFPFVSKMVYKQSIH